jgi:phosphopentomutase
LTGPGVRPNVSIGTRSSYADLGQTIADIFGVGPLANGHSFRSEILK